MSVRPFPRERANERFESAYQAARSAFLRADNDSCLALLQVCDPKTERDRVRVDLLRAHLARVRDDRPSWLAAATAAARVQASTEDDLTALALVAAATRRLGDDVGADLHFENVCERLARARATDGVYARYLLALDRWERGAVEDAERFARETIAAVPDATDSIALLGWIAVKRGDLPRSIEHFVRALDVVRATQPRQVRHHAVLILAIAISALESVDLAVCRAMQREFDSFAWPPSMEFERFTVLAAQSEAALLDGDLERAWFVSREAIAASRSEPLVARAEINSAQVARELGDEHIAKLQLERAWDLIRDFNWKAATVDDRVALWSFATEAASMMPSEARQALMLYLSSSGSDRVIGGLSGHGRLVASEFYAAGRVAEAVGQREEAIARYRSALSIFGDLRMPGRAAAVAVDLYRLTGDPSYREPLDVLAKLAPNATVLRRAPMAD